MSTVIMLRSIADIARSEGEQLELIEAKFACLEVFALGGRAKADKAAETGYFAVRAALAREVSEAIKYVARQGPVRSGAPAVVRFISAIVSRFGIVVSEKAAAQAAPVLGAAGGALINAVFIDHFQDMGRGHFIIRRLERAHGKDAVKRDYDLLAP